MIKTGQSESKVAEPSGGKRSVVCWNEDPQAQALRDELTAGNFFIFPLSHLLSAEFMREDERDSLNLVFSTHEVKVCGRHLRGRRWSGSSSSNTRRPSKKRRGETSPHHSTASNRTVQSLNAALVISKSD